MPDDGDQAPEMVLSKKRKRLVEARRELEEAELELSRDVEIDDLRKQVASLTEEKLAAEEKVKTTKEAMEAKFAKFCDEITELDLDHDEDLSWLPMWEALCGNISHSC